MQPNGEVGARVKPGLGSVTSSSTAPPFLVIFPGSEHQAASSYLRELSACDCTSSTIRSYAYDLLRWFRFLHARFVPWERAERVDVRAFVEYLRSAPTATAKRRQARTDAVNLMTGRPNRGEHYAARTINHQLTVLSGFYDHACAADLGPLVNPVPAQRSPGGRANSHRSPMEGFVPQRRGGYRQKVPRPAWRGIPDDAMSSIFDALKDNRDRALLSFWLTSGVRAGELLALRHGDYDFGQHTITVVGKGSRDRQLVPASMDSFVWLSLYMAEAPAWRPGEPVWWTLQGRQRRPLTYHAARAMFARAQQRLGSNWTLHDLRHTAASRFLADPAFTLVDVQTILRHVHVATTTIYTQPRMEDVLAKVMEHFARPATPAPSVEPLYDDGAVRELLGLEL